MRATLSFLLPLAFAAPSPPRPNAPKLVYWLLAGDSTTATDGGWGDAFLSTTVAKGSSGKNYGDSGATTRSFRNEGFWDDVIGEIGPQKNSRRVYVTIQFGHNDQKNGSGVTVESYKTNLATFASEASSAGATPILLTPLTRRAFSGGKVVENLAEQTAATIEVANANNLHWIDLNRASTDYVNAIGQAATIPYNYANGTDRTHLSEWGGVVFGRLVSDLLVTKYPKEFEAVTLKNKTLSALIAAGKPV